MQPQASDKFLRQSRMVSSTQLGLLLNIHEYIVGQNDVVLPYDVEHVKHRSEACNMMQLNRQMYSEMLSLVTTNTWFCFRTWTAFAEFVDKPTVPFASVKQLYFAFATTNDFGLLLDLPCLVDALETATVCIPSKKGEVGASFGLRQLPPPHPEHEVAATKAKVTSRAGELQKLTLHLLDLKWVRWVGPDKLDVY